MNKQNRSSGIFLPIFSLPSRYGIGDIGLEAREFINFLSESGFSYWSILPLCPTSFLGSPYQSFSSKSLNPLFISLDDLLQKGLLTEKDFHLTDWGNNPRKIDYPKLYENKTRILKTAFYRFKNGIGDFQKGYSTFQRKHQFLDYACFKVLKDLNQGKPWNQFSNGYAEPTLEKWRQLQIHHKEEIEFHEWTQYIFLSQWKALLTYAHTKGIQIIGRMPFYGTYDSLDVYKHPRNFSLNKNKETDYVAGYPPDTFSHQGHVWGYPLYHFDYMKRNQYRYLKDRLDFALSLFDLVILDHVRGYWENYMLPKDAKNGLDGLWKEGPGKEALPKIVQEPHRVIVDNAFYHAEGMRQTAQEMGISETRVLEFAYPKEKESLHKPNHYPYSCHSYSTSHNCKPLRGYLQDLSFQELRSTWMQINDSCQTMNVPLAREEDIFGMVDSLLELNLASSSKVAIQSMQDLLRQGNESRIHTPDKAKENWTYRITKEELNSLNRRHLLRLNCRYGRKSVSTKLSS